MAHTGQSIDNPRHMLDTSNIELQADFLTLPSGRLFVLRYQPADTSNKRVILLCPPFAEELNKSRRQITAQARHFCEAGFTVIVFDLYGTGDSDGAFGMASITIWKENYLDVLRWLKSEGFSSCTVWGIRLGALFAMHLQSANILPVANIVLWQPELSGLVAIRQFLRLQSAANMLGDKKGLSISEMEKQLESGRSIEIAGYRISPELYTEIKSLELANHEPDKNCPLHWMQILSPPQTAIPLRVNTLVEQWQNEGAAVQLHAIAGGNFWSPAELVVVPELVTQSVAAVVNTQSSEGASVHVT